MKSRFGAGVSDRANYGFEILQRTAAPVLGDVAEHAMLDLVPLAGPRRIVTHSDTQTQLIGKLLKAEFPQTRSVSVTTSAVGRDQQLGGTRVGFAAHA